MEYTPIIGLEIHVELATASKMFCGCKNDPFYAPRPNMYTCPTCLGLPGALPVPNKKAIEWTVKLGLALGCRIATLSKFDRKNYFYPDLPKGYQISQYDMPFCHSGAVSIQIPDDTGNMGEKRVRIRRVHLEEDTGRLQHATLDMQKVTLVDFNRSGVPLVEIVTEPDIRGGEEAKIFLKKLHQIIRYLDISGADMEKGSMRLEPNISLRVNDQTPNSKRQTNINDQIQENNLPKYKVEVKNINSFNFVKKAIDSEIIRQQELLEEGTTPVQETRGFVESTGKTVSQRVKEGADDYRYFPDPDIPPIQISKDTVAAQQQEIPELPDAKIMRFIHEYHLSGRSCEQLVETRQKADYFESVVSILESKNDSNAIPVQTIANEMINKRVDYTKVSPHEFLAVIRTKREENFLSENQLLHAIECVLTSQAKAVEDFRQGKTQILMFLVGQVKKELNGKGDATTIANMLKKQII